MGFHKQNVIRNMSHKEDEIISNFKIKKWHDGVPMLTCSSVTADLEVIHYGLKVGCGKKDGGSMVICETTSQAIIQVISSAEARRDHIRAMIEDCRTLIKKNWGCRMVHTLLWSCRLAQMKQMMEFADNIDGSSLCFSGGPAFSLLHAS
ncbi:hypothetical protein AAG906_000194 [Vitis piasezkii]